MMNEYREMLKPTLVLAAAIFMMMAPAPDARDITEMTAGFIVPDAHASLLADEMIEPVAGN